MNTFSATQLPWIEHPFRLISWLEMEEFTAIRFCKITSRIGEVSLVIERMPNDIRIKEEGLHELLEELDDQCSAVGLQQSQQACQRLSSDLNEGIEYRVLGVRLSELQKLIWSEMKSQLFLWVPLTRANSYIQKEPYFGNGVQERFPSASYDIEESGKCFACGRFTASVMHCMRILEHGLRALFSALKLKFGEATWKRALERVEKRISVLDSQVKQKLAWKNKRQFYTESVAEFKHFKDAWRNYAAHGRQQYDEERAKKIIEHTRNFMQVLSIRLKEKKQ